MFCNVCDYDLFFEVTLHAGCVCVGGGGSGGDVSVHAIVCVCVCVCVCVNKDHTHWQVLLITINTQPCNVEIATC